jgi:O-antigen ligase
VIPGWITLAALIFNVGWPTKAIVGGVLIISIVSPVAGFLTAIAFAPLGHIVAATVSVETFRMSEAVVLAFAVGWLLRGWTDRRGPRAPFAVGWLLAAAIAASVGGLAWRLARYPGELSSTANLLARMYNLADDPIGFAVGARLIEGVAIAAATVTLFRTRPRLAVVLPAALAASGCAAAIASVLLWYGKAPAAILRQLDANRYRIVAHATDANAAGSGFAMLVCLALGMALRARGRERPVWLALGAANAYGLWLTASRSAMAAAALGIVFMAAWLATTAARSRSVASAVIGLWIAAAAIAGFQLWRSGQRSQGGGLRRQFNTSSLRMIAAEPITGVGVGQYYRTSALFLSPQLAWNYGSENAHNYFLQIAAELGLPGFVLMAAFIGTGLWRGARALRISPHDGRLLGVMSGVGVFLVTCVVSHPFLIDEVAYSFWALLGLLFGLGGSALDVEGSAHGAPRRWWVTAGTAAALVYVAAVAVIGAVRRDFEPPRSAAVDGFYEWETGADGKRFRWTGEYASLFVPSDVVQVNFPVRISGDARALKPIFVTPSVSGVPRSTVQTLNSWSIISVALPDVDAATRFKRINLKVDRTWQPALYIPGSADMREVGVQVGECQLFRRR